MVSVASGPPKIEVPHYWNNSVYLNNWKTSPRAHVKLTRIDTEKMAPDAVEPYQGRRGSYAYKTSVKSAVWTYTGVLRAKTLDELAVLRTGLESAFGNRSDLGMMRLMGDPVSWFYTARVQALTIPDEQTLGASFRLPYQRDFSLSMLLLDPRAYVFIPGTVAQSGANKNCYNSGGTGTDPVFTMSGFAGGTLTGQNNTLGKTLQFTGLPAGNVVVDFFSQKLTVNGVDYTARVSPNSDWWDENVEGLRIQDNTIGWTTPWAASWFHAAEA